MNAEIVDKIKKLRIAKGVSHNDMADRLNITPYNLFFVSIIINFN